MLSALLITFFSLVPSKVLFFYLRYGMMTIKQLTESLPLKILTQDTNLDQNFEMVYSSDLLSQVLAKATYRDLWITVQTHATILGIASIKQIPCIIFSEGLLPQPEVIIKAQEENIVLLSTQETTFELAGKIFVLLKL
jgi:serine kinase of HPr protein (carbohydrate metabolism regulator)